MARKAKVRADWGTSALSLARQRRGRALEDAVRGALAASGGVVARAAKMLGVTRRHLYFVCHREGLDLPAMALEARGRAATPPPA